MSIWSSVKLASDEVWTVGYGAPGDDRSQNLGASEIGGDIDIATATPWYDHTAIRLSIGDEMGDEACVVLPRATAEAVRDALTTWLGETA